MSIRTVAVACFSVAITGTASAQVTITNLGVVPPQTGSSGYMQTCEASAISGDGKTIVGTFINSFGAQQAFTWRADVGMRNTTNGSGEGGVASVAGMSADASVVVGTRGFWWESYRACVWTNGNPPSELSKGISGLGNAFHTYARGVSADGQTIVGSASMNNGPTHAVRWINGAAISLGTGGGTNTSSAAYAISGNSNTIVGVVEGTRANNTYYSQAMRWSESAGITELGFQAMGVNYSYATATNFDGSVIAGSFQDALTGTSKAFKWSSAGGIQDLGLLTGASSSSVGAMSLSGDVLLGGCGGITNGAFMWTQNTGMISLYDYLIAQGLDLTGWNLNTAVGLSADGSTLVGNGTFNGQSRSFVVTGLAIPTPSAFSFLALGGLCVRRRTA